MSTLQKTQREAKKDYKPNGCARQRRQGSQYARVFKNPKKLNNRAVKRPSAQTSTYPWY